MVAFSFRSAGRRFSSHGMKKLISSVFMNQIWDFNWFHMYDMSMIKLVTEGEIRTFPVTGHCNRLEPAARLAMRCPGPILAGWMSFFYPFFWGFSVFFWSFADQIGTENCSKISGKHVWKVQDWYFEDWKMTQAKPLSSVLQDWTWPKIDGLEGLQFDLCFCDCPCFLVDWLENLRMGGPSGFPSKIR